MSRDDDEDARPPKTRRRPHQLGDYPVGYGRPPKEHQFKPGERGNPLGRLKKDRTKTPVNVATLLLEPVEVKVGGRTVKMPFLEAQIQLTKQKAAKGDHKAMLLLLQMAKEFGLFTARLSEEHRRIIVEVVAPGKDKID